MAKAKKTQNWFTAYWQAMLKLNTTASSFNYGRAYASAGDVKPFQVNSGLIEAKVRTRSAYNSGKRSNEVSISVAQYDAPTWQLILELLRENIPYVTRMMAGDLPEQLAAHLHEIGVELLITIEEMKPECNCVSLDAYCKHVTGVCFQFGREVEREPFNLFTLRGMDKRTILAALGMVSEEQEEPPIMPPSGPPLPLDPTQFWRLDEPQVTLTFPLEPFAESPIAFVQLGNPPFWSEGNLVEALLPVYQVVSEKATKAETRDGT